MSPVISSFCAVYNNRSFVASFNSMVHKISLTLWHPGGFIDFRKKTAVFGCLTNALAPPLIVLESCSRAQTDRPV